MKLNFICPGFFISATTILYDVLVQYPAKLEHQIETDLSQWMRL